jgi:hypothetical protein
MDCFLAWRPAAKTETEELEKEFSLYGTGKLNRKEATMKQVSEIEFQKAIIREYYEQDNERRDELFKNFQNYRHSDYPEANDHFVEFQLGCRDIFFGAKVRVQGEK